ncbi:tRNA modification GTPase trmE [Desulfuromusa kysingii]|uniref:tRNA modification GTPase MnmE n=1 Tax=Desulfuromusa kysingii TaxID=37625 RepID=A0A1H4AJV7_9BACT|nr:tRNA uridine-5-carboxymethylaminomethyl(34) synthesis GTPase MnmE [Desulfuromusa kysingii]SEA36253.1 tRNA modification GTPase trmE [Desulfuromusa kysingii]
MNTSDTIIAPATGSGDAGIAIIRISGADSLSALFRFFTPTGRQTELQSHRLYHGLLRNDSDFVVDEVMAVYMAAPHTYTREDVVEIQCHGGQQVIKSILKLYQSFGIRLAQPGEFTYRAFMNGRLDLSQAEAVSQLIHAKTDSSRKLAIKQMGGGLSRVIYNFSSQLKHILVLTEAWLDFPEEDLPDEDIADFIAVLTDLKSKILTITETYSCGRVLTEGASILLVGQPNAGKSSLMNALLGEDRAIVTDVPGTTRDFLEEGLSIDGVPVSLVDTAGLRTSSDIVEIEGIRRTEEKISLADLVLLVVDSSRTPDQLDFSALESCSGRPIFVVYTKIDKAIELDFNTFGAFPVYRVSSKTAEGLDSLRHGISSFLKKDYTTTDETVLLTESRHFEALQRCLEPIGRALFCCQNNADLELIAFDIREALYFLGQISGETTTEDILDDIFSGFCIGK